MIENEGVKYPGPLSAESVVVHLNKVKVVHFESRLILYNVINNNSELEWRRKQKICIQ